MESLEKKHSILKPAQLISVSFAGIIAVGTILLMLPFSSRSGQFTPFVDSLFTATSATCVTGLIVYDTYRHWSAFGQVIILAMIQIGGLGLVTFASFFNLAVGKKLGLRGAQLASESVGSQDFSDAATLLKTVMALSFSAELAGSLLLMPVMIPKYGAHGIFVSIFTAVSAFCNAGFDIFGQAEAFTSLTGFNGNPYVLFVIALLIIMGGLGFIVWYDIIKYFKTKKLLLHTRIVLMVTAVLLVLGTLIFLLFEWNNPETLGGLPVWQRLGAAFFQSVTLRTAGFNSVSIEDLHGITKMLSIVLMFIGAAPGGTGGGIKVTTIAVVVMTVVSVVRGKDDTVIMRRKVAKQSVYKSLAIIFISLLLLLLVTATIYFSSGEKIDGIDSLFESVSAFATVGISTGVTAVANLPSKLILALTMFIGRVGPVGIAISLTMRATTARNEVIPEGKIMVG